MFHAIPAPIQECMRDLQARDVVKRLSGLPEAQRLVYGCRKRCVSGL